MRYFTMDDLILNDILRNDNIFDNINFKNVLFYPPSGSNALDFEFQILESERSSIKQEVNDDFG